MFPRLLSLLFLPSIFGLDVLTARTWTDAQGRPIEGDLVAIEGPMVRIRLADGETATVPRAGLSPKDQGRKGSVNVFKL